MRKLRTWKTIDCDKRYRKILSKVNPKAQEDILNIVTELDKEINFKRVLLFGDVLSDKYRKRMPIEIAIEYNEGVDKDIQNKIIKNKIELITKRDNTKIVDLTTYNTYEEWQRMWDGINLIDLIGRGCKEEHVPKVGIKKTEWPHNILEEILGDEYNAQIVSDDLLSGLEILINSLNYDRIQDAVYFRFRDKRTFKSISESFGISSNRVVQIVNRALRLLGKRRSILLNIINSQEYISKLKIDEEVFNKYNVSDLDYETFIGIGNDISNLYIRRICKEQSTSYLNTISYNKTGMNELNTNIVDSVSSLISIASNR